MTNYAETSFVGSLYGPPNLNPTYFHHIGRYYDHLRVERIEREKEKAKR